MTIKCLGVAGLIGFMAAHHANAESFAEGYSALIGEMLATVRSDQAQASCWDSPDKTSIQGASEIGDIACKALAESLMACLVLARDASYDRFVVQSGQATINDIQDKLSHDRKTTSASFDALDAAARDYITLSPIDMGRKVFDVCRASVLRRR